MRGPEKSLDLAGCTCWPLTRRRKAGLNSWERLPGGTGGGKKGWVVRRWNKLKKAFVRLAVKSRIAEIDRAHQRGRFGYDPKSYALNFDEAAVVDEVVFRRDFSTRYVVVSTPATYVIGVFREGETVSHVICT